MTADMPMGPRNPILHNTRLCLFWSASIMGCCNGVAKDYPLSQQDLETQVGASNEMPKSPVTLQSAITLQNTNLRKQGCPTHSLPGCVMQLLATCVNYMMWNVRYSTYCNSQCCLQARPHLHLWSFAKEWLETPVIEYLLMG